MTEPFSHKLSFVLKSLSVSRGWLASELRLDKSVISRWMSGATRPSDHNLARLSVLLSRFIPTFTALDWDRDLAGLAVLCGVDRATPSSESTAQVVVNLPLHFSSEIIAATRRRGRVYEGLYRSTRPYSAYPGHYVRDHVLVRAGDDGLLRLRMASGGVRVEGWVFPLNNQLYAIGSEFTSGAMVFALLHGVNGTGVEILDGLIMAPSLDTGRTPVCSAIVLHRQSGLPDNPDDDDALLDNLGRTASVIPQDQIPADVRRHLERSTPEAQESLLRGLLRLPLAESLSSGPGP